MNKIGFCTLYSSYNFGSSLQAFATKSIIEYLGYDACLLDFDSSFVKGRKINFKKIFIIGTRFLFHPLSSFPALKAYFKSPSNTINNLSKIKFLEFYNTFLKPRKTNYHQIKKEIKNNEFSAFLCGSDQIWNGQALYVNKSYFLTFAPNDMKIAFAPSFGGKDIAVYNRKCMARYLKSFSYLSSREEIGCDIIKKISGKNSTCLMDPTLFFSKDFWTALIPKALINNKYILVYFLSEMNSNAIEFLDNLVKNSGLSVIKIGHNCNYDGVGPIEFLNLINNADYVLTDSFHGLAFSLILNKEIYVFERKYGFKNNQSIRISGLLEKINLMNRFESKNVMPPISWSSINLFFKNEREKTITFLKKSLSEITEGRKNE